MFRRCVSTFVLLGFVAGQLATIPHAHGGYSPEEQRQHDARPHVHIGRCEHSHDHNHSHAGYSHSHQPDNLALAGVERSPARGCARNVEHNADAIYLPCGPSAPVTVKDQRTATSADLIPIADSKSESKCLVPEPPFASVPFQPPNRLSGAKLFLTLRTLRI